MHSLFLLPYLEIVENLIISFTWQLIHGLFVASSPGLGPPSFSVYSHNYDTAGDRELIDLTDIKINH